MTLVQADLSQAELRVMAALSGDKWMLNALQEGQGDFFDSHMMPICFPQVDLLGLSPVDHKEFRTKVKTVQYGLAFGRQAMAIGIELGISVHEAQDIIDNYLNTAQEFALWREDVMAAATDESKRDFLVSPFGRRFQSEVITKKNKSNVEREALSFLPQSTASDICLTTAIRVHPVIKSEYNSHIVSLVHDAILVECPNPVVANEVGKMIQKEFRKTGEMVFGDLVPFLSAYDVGDSWGALS
jgi:DNA polymerase I - 3''-5'' exonuclease and polymerase domains